VLFANFPTGRFINDYERRILALKEELRPILDELSWRLHAYWDQEKEDLTGTP